MGRRLLRLLGLAPGFLSAGVTAAVLRDEGTIPEVREEWVMDVMRGAREGAAALTRTVGRGSSWQVEVFDFFMSWTISETGGRENAESDWGGGPIGGKEGGFSGMDGISC